MFESYIVSLVFDLDRLKQGNTFTPRRLPCPAAPAYPWVPYLLRRATRSSSVRLTRSSPVSMTSTEAGEAPISGSSGSASTAMPSRKPLLLICQRWSMKFAAAGTSRTNSSVPSAPSACWMRPSSAGCWDTTGRWRDVSWRLTRKADSKTHRTASRSFGAYINYNILR